MIQIPASKPLQAPLDALWQAPVIIAVILAGELLAATLALAPGIESGRWVYFGLSSLVIQWISLPTLGALYLIRTPLSRLRPQQVAQAALAALLIVTGLICLLIQGLTHDVMPIPRNDWMSLWLQFTGIALAMGILSLVIFQNHWNARQLAVRAKQAELEALQARIHPHFLFNTLNTGIALLHQRPEAAEQLLLDLADLFRAALAGPPAMKLAEELALTERYLKIEALRFGKRLRIAWQLPSPLPDIEVPTLSIQTLAENAIRHGVEPSANGGEVLVRVVTYEDRIELSVTNDVPSTPLDTSIGHRIGLNAVRSRLDSLTDGKGRLDTDISDGRHLATIVMPLIHQRSQTQENNL
ncbi:histidine kinase [Xanthomonas sp. 4461]|uniref:sensor histidine kinase n=1 Tax=Xanthomonas sp. 4461 TaxID=3035313 RepID=UPI002169BC6A|nr:histidine kinase [Xanthomonas sp. 4461]MCS3807279.1 two-component system sensor histidine kinase AlgZ [Xanthomonas sp. 4461]